MALSDAPISDRTVNALMDGGIDGREAYFS